MTPGRKDEAPCAELAPFCYSYLSRLECLQLCHSPRVSHRFASVIFSLGDSSVPEGREWGSAGKRRERSESQTVWSHGAPLPGCARGVTALSVSAFPACTRSARLLLRALGKRMLNLCLSLRPSTNDGLRAKPRVSAQ